MQIVRCKYLRPSCIGLCKFISLVLRSGYKLSISKLSDKNIRETTSLQRKVILGFLKGSDTLASLPVGYGKSLLYQLAVRVAAELSSVDDHKDLFATKSVGLVVAPLNAIIKDQLLSCEKLGIKATKTDGSELPSLEGTEIAYVNPETLALNKHIIPELGECLLGIVVDESHCVNKWYEKNCEIFNPQLLTYSSLLGSHRATHVLMLLCHFSSFIYLL